MAFAKEGDTVSVHYVGRLPSGVVFDSSLERGPFEFTIGEGSVIAGFEQAVIGQEVGSTKEVEVPPELGYGEYRTDLVYTFKTPRSATRTTRPALGTSDYIKNARW